MFFRTVIDRCIDKVRVTMPCKILSYDRSTHVANVRVMFNWELPDGSVMNGCDINGITLRRMFAGGFLIDFPINEGDTGWIIATDRDATTVKTNRIPSLPASPFCNSYASGFFIPDQWGSNDDLGINIADEGRLVVQNADGTQKISIGTGDIKVYGTKIELHGPTEIDGTLDVSGLITANGDVVNADNIKLGTHHHDNSGNPIPG